MTHRPTFVLTYIRAAVFPRIAFEPVVHLHYAVTVLPMKDGLPKLSDFPIKGTGSRVAEPARRRINNDNFRLYALFTRTCGDASSHQPSQS